MILSLIFAALISTNLFNKGDSPVNISSQRTFYDRNAGLIVFQGNVRVIDREYLMRSDRAYVFMNEANDVKRVAAVGNVALTNGFRRAYGEKATYQRSNGLVVLHGVDGKPAEVVEELTNEVRTVKGRKIRFWTNEEQVEVLEMDATIGKQYEIK